MTFVDSNVIFDIVYKDAAWMAWSVDAFFGSALPRRIAPIVYAELAGSHRSRADLDDDLAVLDVQVEELNRGALFEAGRAHTEYRRRGGPRDRVLPDFLIGAQALERDAVLVTRDPRRYRTAFPDLILVTP